MGKIRLNISFRYYIFIFLFSDFKSAQNILETMRIAHIVPSSRTYTALLRGCAEAGDTDQFRTAVNLAANREFTSRQLISILHSVCLSENVQLLPLVCFISVIN